MTCLCLSRNNLGPHGAAFLATAIRDQRLPALQDLVLRGNNIQPSGTVELANAIGTHARALTSLSLCENAVGGVAGGAMTDSEEEDDDDLFAVEYDDSGARALSEAVPKSAVRRLCLFGNAFDPKARQALEELQRTWPSTAVVLGQGKGHGACWRGQGWCWPRCCGGM